MNLSLGGDLHGFAPLYRGFTWTGLTRSEATLQPGKVGGGYHNFNVYMMEMNITIHSTTQNYQRIMYLKLSVCITFRITMKDDENKTSSDARPEDDSRLL